MEHYTLGRLVLKTITLLKERQLVQMFFFNNINCFVKFNFEFYSIFDERYKNTFNKFPAVLFSYISR